MVPEKFVDELPLVLKDATPLPGEEARYAEVLAVIAAAQKDPTLKAAMIDEAKKAEQDLVDPLLQFRNYGLPLAHHWTTQSNGARVRYRLFHPHGGRQVEHLRQQADRDEVLLPGPRRSRQRASTVDSRYTVTFAKGQLPPVKGFWSLTLYNQHHFFAPNEIKRYSVGTKNKDLKPNADGSLTIYVQADAPSDPAQRANWLPAPKGEEFSLYIRAYWPEAAITSGQWTPPAVDMVQ